MGESGAGETVLVVDDEPPRRLMNDVQWAPEIPVPLKTVHGLIVQGVCRVRNSHLHGEKFRGGPDGQWDRDVTLIKEARAVLKATVDWWLRAKNEKTTAP